jgi:hypothetical protein
VKQGKVWQGTGILNNNLPIYEFGNFFYKTVDFGVRIQRHVDFTVFFRGSKISYF